MTTDQDPRLASLFKNAELEYSDEAFTTSVMSEVENRRRRSIIAWSVTGLLLVIIAWFLVLVVQDAVFLLTQILPETIIDLENRWIERLLAPVNSVSGLLGLAGLSLWLAFRKLF